MNLISAPLILSTEKNEKRTLWLFMKRCHTHTLKCQRGNELLIRQDAPERSPALINFVPASDKESRRNMVNWVSLGTSSIQLEVAILRLLEILCIFYAFQNQLREAFMLL